MSPSESLEDSLVKRSSKGEVTEKDSARVPTPQHSGAISQAKVILE